MKFTISWLKEHLSTSADLDTISSTLTNIGLEVESIEDRVDELKPFTVARVKQVAQHPNADRLKVCKVETIDGIFQVVCGATNVETGMLGVFAPENSFIPGTKIKLKKSIIRGVESCGMLVSEKEMGISNEHEGIIKIEQHHNIGDSFSLIYALDDPVVEINITPNRPDCLSVRGIARDLAAAGLGKLKNVSSAKISGSFESPIKWKRQFNEKENHVCPGVSGRYFANVNNCESPDWLKKKLIAIGLKPISALVDITNFITYDLGRPLHVYDADKIKGNLTMRLAANNETCKTLDEKEYKLSSEMVIISDDKEVHGIGGVMGGLSSGCSLKTKNVFLEVALFDPISVTKTGRKLNLQSDARYRFERGIDPKSIVWGVNKATKIILDLCGGEASNITSDIIPDKKNKIVDFAVDKTLNLVGIDIQLADQIKILERLGFVIESQDDKIVRVVVPSFRPDIDGQADIVEEIIRIYGYHKIQPISVQNDLTIKKEILNDKLKSFYRSKRLIASRGYYETVTWSFMSSNIASYFNKGTLTQIKNPISSDLDVMRPTIIPNLLLTINKNIGRMYYSGKIFEVGQQFRGPDENEQEMVATGIQYGSPNSLLWNQESRNSDVFDIKSDVYFVLDQLHVPIDNLLHEKVLESWYHPGKSSLLRIGKSIIANYGEIHPFILQKYEIENTVLGFEIFLDQIAQFNSRKSSTKNAYDANPLQAIERDFAFLFSKNIKGADIIQAVKKIDKRLIKKVIIFDVFEGGQLAENTKSIAFKVVLQPIESTFTDKEIEKISKLIINHISNTFDGQLRQ